LIAQAYVTDIPKTKDKSNKTKVEEKIQDLAESFSEESTVIQPIEDL
jgi:hypothetical protein